MSERTQYFDPPLIEKPRNLKLRDVVRMRGNVNPFGTAVVYNIRDGMVHFYRPYAVTADFETTGGVIPYIGIEDYAVELTSSVEYEVLERGPAPK